MKVKAKRSLRVAIALLICLVMMSSFFAPVFAWYINKLSTKLNIEADIVGSYFEQGNGTEDMPYVIHRPIQLYYFAWLQNLGYFDGDNPASTTSDKKYYFTLSSDIDMSENAAYSVLPPIGTIDHPFVGVFDGRYHYQEYKDGNPVADELDPNNTLEGTYHTISNLTISNDDLSNVPQNGEEEQQFVGLFGVIGSMTNHSVTGTVKNFALNDVVIETKSPLNDKTIIGIVAGYCNGIFEGIGVSDCTVKVKNGVSPADVTTYNADDGTSSSVTPGMISFSLVGFTDQTYQAYNISPVAGGNEFGGSLAMEEIYDKITAARDNANASRVGYYTTKVVEIDADGGRTETYSNEIDLDYHREFSYASSQSPHNMYYFINEYEAKDDNEVIESYALVDRYSGSSTTKISDGAGNFLRVSNSALTTTRNYSDATTWTISQSGGNWRFAYNSQYLSYNNGNLTYGTSYYWTISNTDVDYQEYLFKTNTGNNYIYYDRTTGTWGITTNANDAHLNMHRTGGSTVTQYTYLNGGRIIEKEQAVTTITHTRYDAYYIQDGSDNYLAAQAQANGTISRVGSSASATAWRFSNGASGGTFSIQSDDEITYYLRNNNGTLEISTTSTSWTISNGQISNGGYYLVYLDGAWKLRQETTYFDIVDNDSHYLNYTNGSLAGGNSATTRWHIDGSNRIYFYNSDTKTYIYNNSGALATTTNSGTASAWTVSSANHTIKQGDYYLMYLDGAWKLLAETTYYSISNGNGTYLNYTNGSLAGGNSATTRWHIDANNKIYTYNGTTKTYLYNNSGALTTTTTVGTASAFTIDNANHVITTSNRYLCYNDDAWSLKEEVSYYLINDGASHYLNLSGSSVASGTSSNATRWYFVGGKIYAYNGTTKTYLYNNGGVLATTTNTGTASTWTIDTTNHTIKQGSYYLAYNDGAWGITKETEYYYINDGSTNYLNLSGGSVATGTSSNASRWYIDGGKIYAYNGTTATYLLDNNGALSTTTTEGSATVWTITDNRITHGSYYLIFDSTWRLTSETEYYKISDGNSHYLNLDGSGNVETGTSSNATQWFFTNGASGGKLYAYVNGTATYIYNNNGTLAKTTNANTATAWTVSSGNISNGSYYLVYQNDWKLTSETTYYLISDGSGNYLNLSSSGNVETGTSSNATGWHFTNGATGGKIYAYANGTPYYLYSNSGALATTTNSGTGSTWAVSNGQITTGGNYLIYDTCWFLSSSTTYYKIYDDDNHYLNYDGTNFSAGTSSTATKWQMSSTTSGTIYTYISGTPTYIYRNGSNALATTTNSGASNITWTISSANHTIQNGSYYLDYVDDAWVLTNNSSMYYIHDNNGHYLNLTYSNSTALTAVGTASNATVWTYSNSKLSAVANNTTYYLNYNSSNMVPDTTGSTNWTSSNNTIYCTSNSTNYYMFCDGECWTIVRNGLNSYYLISDGNEHYLSCNATDRSNVTVETVRSYARKWEFGSGISTSTSSSISTNINGTPYYFYRYSSGNTYTLQVRTTSNTSWRYNSTNRYIYYRGTNSNSQRYVRYYNNGWSSMTSNNSATAIGSIENITSSTRTAIMVALPHTVDYSSGTYNASNTISSNSYNLTNSIVSTAYNLTVSKTSTALNTTANGAETSLSITAVTSSASYPITANTVSHNYDITDQIEATTTIWKATTHSYETIEVKTKETYIPLASNNGTTSLRNTGYIVSGSNYHDRNTYTGDIRVSYYGLGYLYNAFGYTSTSSSFSYNDARLEIVTRTYLSNGFKRISDSYNSNNSNVSSTLSASFPNNQKTNYATLGLTKYEEARDQLSETMTGQSNVYGLHFMDAQISASNLVNIGKAVINGSTYHDYKMPQDCIDFNLSMRGSLNFFAGTYFPGNAAFFSLHRIFRSDGEITSIREIDKIYGDPNDNSKAYIYKYMDDANAPSLPTGYVLMFDTDWIKNPDMVDYAMYYFEIPVNAGEYALGSVSGADGAYLIYLDIGASAQSLSDGTTLETAIKGIDFVTETSIATASIGTTLAGISSSSPSSAVIILKRGFQGDITFSISTTTVQGATVLRIAYTLSNVNSKDYVLWTKADTSVEVVDGTAYT